MYRDWSVHVTPTCLIVLSSLHMSLQLQSRYSGLLVNPSFLLCLLKVRKAFLFRPHPHCSSLRILTNRQYIHYTALASNPRCHTRPLRKIYWMHRLLAQFQTTTGVHKDIILAEILLYILDRGGFAIGIPMSPPVMYR